MPRTSVNLDHFGADQAIFRPNSLRHKLNIAIVVKKTEIMFNAVRPDDDIDRFADRYPMCA